MSRGLGRVQREILDTIDTLPGWMGVYDLRYVKRQVAGLDECRTFGSRNQYCHGSFSVTFHRAAHSLVKRGLLERVHGHDATTQLRYVRRPKC